MNKATCDFNIHISDDIRRITGGHSMSKADRAARYALGEAYIQQWTVLLWADDDDDIKKIIKSVERKRLG